VSPLARVLTIAGRGSIRPAVRAAWSAAAAVAGPGRREVHDVGERGLRLNGLGLADDGKHRDMTALSGQELLERGHGALEPSG